VRPEPPRPAPPQPSQRRWEEIRDRAEQATADDVEEPGDIDTGFQLPGSEGGAATLARPEPPTRPEPPVSRRVGPTQDNRQFVDLPPRAPERGATGDAAFQLGPSSQAKNKRGRRQEVQPRDIRAAAPTAQSRTGSHTRPPRKKRPTPGKKSRQTEITVPKESKRVIRIEETITLQELAKRMAIKATEVIVKLMEMGVGGIHINSMLDADMAKIIAEEFHYQVEDVSVSEEELLAAARADQDAEVPDEDLTLRPPVVTMLGHVDHGKTSLLDKIREARVALGEAGGITQHIGAYQAQTNRGLITFIDTPGHEAFTAMRARGAKATDISVLVVAADDGVMPTTREAISHARAANTPIVVALNKMDLHDANPDLALRGLAEEGLQPEEWGGETTVCRVSAKTGEGIDHLLEMILLTAELMELRANPKAPGQGVVLEAKLEKGRGPVATVLIQDGTLRVGDYIVAGAEHGKIRAFGDEKGHKLTEAGPSTPVEILGLSGVPGAGDHVDVVTDAKKGEQLAARRTKAVSAANVPPSTAMADIVKQIQRSQQNAEKIEMVNLVIKGDVQGSVEAVREKVASLSTDEVEVKVIHAGVGGITESDVLLASASDPKAIIIGFGVRPAGKARGMAEREHVELKFHNIIYELIDDVKDMMLGRLRPTFREVELGRAEVRKVFHIPKVGVIAGCYVLEGKVARSAQIRLVRDSVQVWKGKLGSLKRFEDDAKEVAAGFECGIRLEGFNDLKEADVIEAYETEEVAPSL
jgi:translation initiation factor IF-2